MTDQDSLRTFELVVFVLVALVPLAWWRWARAEKRGEAPASWRRTLLSLAVAVFAASSLLLAVALRAAKLDAADASPGVEVFTATSAPRGGQFSARAGAFGCSPKSYEWSASPGCVVVSGQGQATATLSCDVTGSATVRAVAKGGGCGGAAGETSIAVGGTDPVTVPQCADGADPGPVVARATGWYYRPGLQSTGRLGMVVTSDKVRQTFETRECVERPAR